MKSLHDRLWAKVEIAQPHQCWPFLGACGKGGYGRIGLGTREQGTAKAATVVAEQFHGPRPSGQHQVRHLCGNRPCCNPTHLAWGTQSDNEMDKVRHGVSNRGERHGMGKLTERQVLAIRKRCARGENQTVVGGAYGISQQTVSDIVRGNLWSWLEGGDADGR
jgi:hypothetical protein